ncbi:MAG: methyltransferase domain-containing protein [Bdellovibrionales bacterium]|nr:methyltransferase domain-containing protein [Bdellovibrionales bacterium]
MNDDAMCAEMLPESRRSLLPHWDGEIYSRIAAPFYDLTTRLTGWQEHLGKSALELLPPGRLLDVGCGTGVVLSHAIERGYTVSGIDPSRGMLAQALEQRRLPANCLICGSATELPFASASFDVVLASGSLVHVPDIAKAAAEIVRVTRPGGTIRILDHASPVKRGWTTPLATLFSQLSGDVLHDYAAHFRSGTQLLRRDTLGRGGYLQRFDFRRLSSADAMLRSPTFPPG